MISTRALAIASLAAVSLWQGAWTVAAMVSYSHNTHRMMNVTNPRLSGPVTDKFASAAAHFLRTHATPGLPLVVFAGSSVTFGYSFSADAIFSHHVARKLPGDVVLNISLVGASTSGLIGPLLCGVDASGVEVDTLFLEIVVVNDAVHAARGGSNKPYDCWPAAHLLPLFLTQQIGIDWLDVFPDEYRDNFDSRPVLLSPLPADFIAPAPLYAAAAEELSRVRRLSLAAVRDRVRHLVVIPSPVYVDGLEKLGFDRGNIQRQMADALADCRAVQGVTCLDTRAFSSDPDMFINVTHLGLKGHTRFAEWVLERTRQTPDLPLVSQAQGRHRP